jgi:hypothetical protein
MRRILGIAVVVAGCASAGAPGAETGDDTQPLPSVDAALPPDACGDDDGDTICNVADKCAGHDDRVDGDMDTIADGCDRCPMADDRPDLNMNGNPDCLEIQQRTIDLKVVDGNLWRGWHTDTGGHQSTNENTLTGVLPPSTYHSYYVFSLTGFTAHSIQGVTLEIQLENYTADASETFSLWDVTTPATTIENTAGDITTHNDLGGGMTYGTGTATAAQVGQILSVPLNATAAMHATQKLGMDFVIGMKLDTAPGWIRFGHTGAGATPTTIRIVVRYLP